MNIFDIETRMKVRQQAVALLQAEKMTSLGRLAAGIAHEINNPLTNVLLSIQSLRGMLAAKGADKEIREKIDVAERNIDRAARIARELLQFSRQPSASFSPLPLSEVVRGALILLEYRLKDVSVELELPYHCEVMGDKVKLEQVFVNIISNSLEAMPEGGRLAITAAERNGLICVSISDTGIGIAPEHLGQLFDPFFTTKEVGKGTGLGLSICYGIIKEHGGSVDIFSQPGGGTTVEIKIPTCLTM